MRLKSPVLLIDGDIIAYRAAAATDGRLYRIEWKTEYGPHMVRFEKYKKDADTIAAELQHEGIECTVELEHKPEPLRNALKIIKDSLLSLETALQEHVDGLGPRQIFITRGGSFRDKEVPEYKQLRADMRRPKHLEACKDYLVKHFGARCEEGLYEADDLLAMAATEYPESSVVCSIDKDLLQVPGYHFNWVKGEFTHITQVEALRNLYGQLLTGDTADGIPGIRGIGLVKAKRLLEQHDDPFIMYCEVLRAYIRETGKDDTESMEDYYRRCIGLIRVHMRLLYLLRSPEDRWEVPKKADVDKATV